MKRIIGTVVALGALLAFGSVSRAAVITFDVGAAGNGTLNTASTLAPFPPGYFTTIIGSPSSITVDTDADGNGTAGDVALLSGSLHIAGVTDLGPYGTFISDVTTALSGGTGVLSGEDILWNATPGTSFASTGTFGCTGAICGLLGITEGTVYPLSVYQAFQTSQGVVQVGLVSLGIWDILAGQIVGTNMAVSAIVGATGQPAQWINIGANLGPVPEPGALALVVLGLSGLALRSRKA